jgi:hypothetical protein
MSRGQIIEAYIAAPVFVPCLSFVSLHWQTISHPADAGHTVLLFGLPMSPNHGALYYDLTVEADTLLTM